MSKRREDEILAQEAVKKAGNVSLASVPVEVTVSKTNGDVLVTAPSKKHPGQVKSRKQHKPGTFLEPER